MTEDQEDVVESIFDIGHSGEADALLEMTIATVNSKLYEDAIEAFGSWDAALAQAVVESLMKHEATKPKRFVTSTEETIERVRKSEVADPLFARTTDGIFFWIPGDEFEITRTPQVFGTPEGVGPIEKIWHIGDPDGVFIYSNIGRYYGLFFGIIPQWAEGSPIRNLHQILTEMHQTEHVRCVSSRKAGQSGRYIHITENAKGKASDASELGATLDKSGREAFLLKGDDLPVATLATKNDATVFCASAQGQGIHFESQEMRSMGRKAVGVNVMKLSGTDDRIVNGFIGDDVTQLAVVTELGLGKRIWFEEFRTQGRGGSGMQVLKLEKGDAVCNVVPIESDDDLILLTNKSRAHRVPAAHFLLMGRPAKGTRVIDLQEGEKVIGLASAPCSTTD